MTNEGRGQIEEINANIRFLLQVMKLAIHLSLLSAANLGISFLIQWYLITHLGPGVEMDAFIAGSTVPQVVLAVISGTIMHVLVPIFSGENEVRFRQSAWSFFLLIGILFGSLSLVLYLTAPWFVPLAFPGFNLQASTMTIELTRVLLVGMMFSAVNGVQCAAYHAKQKFIWAELVTLLSGLILLVCMVWGLPRYGVIAAAWITVLRFVLQTILLMPSLGMPVRINFKDGDVSLAWRRIKPILVASSYYKTEPAIDRYLLSNTVGGSLTIFYLAQQIFGAASGVLNKAIAAPLVPALSGLFKAGNSIEFSRKYHRNLMKVGAISFALLLALVLEGEELLLVIFQHGRISQYNVHQLWLIMISLGGMFFATTLGQISSSSYYASGDTKTITRVSMISYTAYIPLKLVAFLYWSVVGLALASSAFHLINVTLQIFYLKKKTVN